MTKNELEQSLKTTLNQIEELKKKAEKIIEELKRGEIQLYPEFEKGSSVFFMDVNFDVREGICYNPKAISDYNSFHSKHYAEMLAERSNYLAMLLHCKWYFDRDYKPDWDNPIEEKWTVGFSHASGKIMVYNWTVVDFGIIAFSSKEVAQKACDWLNSNGKGITI